MTVRFATGALCVECQTRLVSDTERRLCVKCSAMFDAEFDRRLREWLEAEKA